MTQHPAMTPASAGAEAGMLLGRERELATVAHMLERTRTGDGAVVAIEGTAGIGKTALLTAVLRDAGEAGARVLAATAAPLEASFPFGVARQLFEPVRREVGETAWEDVSGGAARFSARALGERALETADPGDDPSFATLHGLYWLTANLALEGPLVLAIDDIQWADRPSLRYLCHLVRRLDGVAATVVFALRTGEPATDPRLLSELLVEGADALRLGPLGERDATELVRARGRYRGGPARVLGRSPRHRRQPVPARRTRRGPALGGSRGGAGGDRLPSGSAARERRARAPAPPVGNARGFLCPGHGHGRARGRETARERRRSRGPGDRRGDARGRGPARSGDPRRPADARVRPSGGPGRGV